jgi:2-phosphosulfolactate phosphatase
MKLIITSDQNLHEAKELVVVIDVYRAFTTTCYAMNSGPKDYIVVDDLNLAYELKRKNSDCVLIGERDGLSLPGFDYCNSPTEIENADFSNKTVVHTTSLGTRGIISALKYTKKVITGSFVNAGAIISYIKKDNPDYVHLFYTDNTTKNNEDQMFAKYVKGHFENQPLDINNIKNYLIEHESGINYVLNPRTKFSKNDFFLSLELDKFNFVLKASLKSDKLIHLEKILLP